MNHHLIFTAGLQVCYFVHPLCICMLAQHAQVYSAYSSVLISVQHILGNLVMQLLLGIPLELVHKGFEVGMVYLSGVLAGEHTPLPLHPQDTCSTASCIVTRAAFKLLS